MLLLRRTTLLFAIALLPPVTIFARFHPVVQRGILFEDVRSGLKIVEPPIKIFRRKGRILCAKLCIRHPECLSFNHCHSDICLLYSLDAFSVNLSLEKNSQCDYVGLNENHFPHCLVGINQRDIKDDSLPNECKINQKRVDAEWTMWSQNIYIDTADEWKRYETRGCVMARHGGRDNLCSGSQQKILEWVKFVHEPAHIYDVGFSSCIDLGGKLFTSLNGTQSQLEFFYNRVGPNCYWLGITTDDPTTWETNNEGVANEDIIWAAGEPNNWNGQYENRTLVLLQNDTLGVNDINTQFGTLCCSVCEMSVGIESIL